MKITKQALASLIAQAVSDHADAEVESRRSAEEAAREAAEAAQVVAGFAGLTRAVGAAVRIAQAQRREREVRMAVFDADGAFIGEQSGTAAMLGTHAGDPYIRLAWREEWDQLPLSPMADSGPLALRMRRSVPDLSSLTGVEAEILGQIAEAMASAIL